MQKLKLVLIAAPFAAALVVAACGGGTPPAVPSTDAMDASMPSTDMPSTVSQVEDAAAQPDTTGAMPSAAPADTSMAAAPADTSAAMDAGAPMKKGKHKKKGS